MSELELLKRRVLELESEKGSLADATKKVQQKVNSLTQVIESFTQVNQSLTQSEESLNEATGSLAQSADRTRQENMRLIQENVRLIQENSQLDEDLQKTMLELKLLLKALHGPKSERYIDDPNQLMFDFGDDDQVEDAIEGIKQAKVEQEVEGYTRRRRTKRYERLPNHLPREIIEIDLPDEEKAGLKPMGYDVTEQLVFEPGSLKIIEKRYLKYAEPNNPKAGVKQAPREEGLVAGNRFDTSVAAWIITAKYGYHLPVYRQQDLFAAWGWNPSRGTLLNIMTAAWKFLQPLAAFFADEVRRDNVIGTDDTGVTLLRPKVIPTVDPLDPKSQRAHEVLREAIEQKKSSIKAKMWAYRGVHIPLNVFDFTVSRHRDGPDLFLIENDFEGILLGDCYSGYTGISLRSNDLIAHAACCAHARRKVNDAKENHSAHAKVLLALFRDLYDIEDRARPFNDADRLTLREDEAKPIWDKMRHYIDNQMSNVLPKESMASAVRYIRNQWYALTLYLTNGAIPIDNNATEQLMKQVAIGRKNWLFVGSISAGYRAADFMTLVSSAIRNDLDVWQYLKGVLDALLAGETDFSILRPDAWAVAHPDQVRAYRVTERADRRDRTTARRAHRRSISPQ